MKGAVPVSAYRAFEVPFADLVREPEYLSGKLTLSFLLLLRSRLLPWPDILEYGIETRQNHVVPNDPHDPHARGHLDQ